MGLMRRKIAVYGKGGIGKSTISSNLSASLSKKGIKVLQIGCDPKHDSTRLLTAGTTCRTVLEYLRDVKPEERKLADIVTVGYGDTLCVEAGGPEPGVGCAGRGIISAFGTLSELGVDSLDYDMILYDVLGDVVCGGFAVPIRNEYADTVYVVTSGEFMSIYAANNILRGVSNYNSNRIGGIIFNSRGDSFERERVEAFSEAVGIPIIARIERSKLFLSAERESKTVVEMYPDSDIAGNFSDLADVVIRGDRYEARYLDERTLEKIVLGHEKAPVAEISKKIVSPIVEKPPIYASRSVNHQSILYGCAFAGACSTTLSIEGLTTVMHSPRNCAHFALQLASNSTKRAFRKDYDPMRGFVGPDVVCSCMGETSMIYGGTEQLYATIEERISHGSTRIAVVTSCPPGVIGDDVSGTVERLSLKYPGVKIVYIGTDGNLKGDQMQGLIDACVEITKAFAKRNLPKVDAVNLVGMKPLATNATDDMSIIEGLLGRMGIKVGCKFLGDCSVSDIESMTSAKLCLLITEDQFAKIQESFLKDTYGLRFSKNSIGTGLISTENWLREVGEVFGRQKEAEDVIDSLRSEYQRRVDSLKGRLQGRTVYVTSVHTNIDWILDLIDDFGMVPMRITVLEKPDYMNDADVRLRHTEMERLKTYDMDEIWTDIRERRPDFHITSFPSDIGGDGITQLVIPAPDVGPFGGTDVMERWLRSSMRPKTEGWKKDVI